MTRTRTIAKIKTHDVIGFTGTRNTYTVIAIVPCTGGFSGHIDITIRDTTTGNTSIRRFHRFFGVEMRAA